jgi:hypothetical protein
MGLPEALTIEQTVLSKRPRTHLLLLSGEKN